MMSADMTASKLMRIALGGCLLFTAPALHAATIVKANNTTAISSSGSWVGGVLPAAGDIMLFDSTVTGALTTSGAASMSAATAFQFTNIGGNVTIGVSNGATITLNNATPTYTMDMSAAAADVTIGTTVGSSGTIRWASGVYGGISVATGRTLTMNSNFTNAGNTKTIAMTGGGNIIFNGSAGSGGAMGFSIQGGTTVTMNGTGGWSGSSAKEVISGTLNLGSDTALGAATLTLGGTSANTPTLAATGGARTISNNITLLATSLGGNPTITGSNALTVNGTLTNSGANRTLTVNNIALTTFGGGVALSESASNRTLTINGSGNVTLAGVVANGSTSTASSLTYSGAGLLSLANANTFAGTLTAGSGTTRIDNSLAAQNATVSVGAANAVTFGAGITAATFGSLSGSGDLALVNTDTSNVTLSIGNNNASTTYSGALSGAGAITKIGTGTQTLSSTTSTFSGGTVISAGRITLSGAGSNAAALGTGTVNLQGGTLQLQSNGASSTSAGTFANAIQVDAGQAGTLVSFGRGSLNSDLTGAGTLNLQVDYIRGDVGGDWSAFTGQINVTPNTNGGDFRINNTNGFGTSKINLATGVTMYMNLNFGSGGLTSTIGELTGSGTLRGGPTSGRTMTWNVGGANTDAQFDGIIQNSTGTTAITKSGTGTWTLTGTNTYTGATTISGGALNLGSTGSTGTGAVTVNNGGTLLGTGTVSGSSFTAASGSTVQAGNGTAQADYGTLTFTPASAGGSFDFQSGSSVILGINPGGASDLLNFVGDGTQSLFFNGSLSITASAYSPMAPEVFNLLDWTSLAGTTFHSRFSAGSYSGLLFGNGDDNLGFDLPDISGSGFGWDISSFATNGSIAVVAVPEPSRAVLFMSGLVGLLLPRRRSLAMKC
jgi:autotransporter-associated beta strand protein